MDKWEDIERISKKIVSNLLSNNIDESEDKFRDSSLLMNYKKGRDRFNYTKAFNSLILRNRRLLILRYSKYAAIALLFLSTSLIVLNISKKNIEDHISEIEENSLAEIKPLEKQAKLILNDGKEISLKGIELINNNSHLVSQGNSTITIDSTGLNYSSSGASDSVLYNTIVIPRGSEYYVALEDGTKVWLNADSKLKYPVVFSEDRREVYLEGEAYFEVSHSSSNRFFVVTPTCEVSVLGTKFNVKSYSDEKIVYTTLAQGSISFKELGSSESIILKVGEQIAYSNITGDYVVNKVNVNNYIGWKDKLFTFKNLSLVEIMTMLSRWYCVDIVYESNDIKNLEFSGNLDKYNSIESFFKIFEEGANIDIVFKNNTLFLKTKTN